MLVTLIASLVFMSAPMHAQLIAPEAGVSAKEAPPPKPKKQKKKKAKLELKGKVLLPKKD